MSIRFLLTHVIALPLLLALAWSGSSRASDPPLLMEGDLGPAEGSWRRLDTLPLTDAEARGLFEKVLRLIVERHSDPEMSAVDLYLKATTAMLDMVDDKAPRRPADPQGLLEGSALLHGEGMRSLEDLRLGQKTGVGLEFQTVKAGGGVLVVQRVFPGSPADRGGLLAEDRIVAINGHSLDGTPLGKTLEWLGGAPGSAIVLQVQRPGQAGSFRRTLVRATYPVASVRIDWPSPGVARLQVGQFHGRTRKEVVQALEELRRRRTQRLVLDHRNNQGGLLDQAVGVAGLFLPRGRLITRVEDPRGVGRDFSATGEPLYSGRMVVLVDRFTTAAAEMVAASVQDNGRASLVGERTMGKGSTDQVSFLSPGVAVRLSSLRFLSPEGRSWEGRGIVPEHSMPARWGLGGVDAALIQAIEVVSSQEADSWVPNPPREQGPVRPASARP